MALASSKTTIDDLVKVFSKPKLRFEGIVDDPRLFQGTTDALKALNEGEAVAYPNEDTTPEDRKEWWKTMGPAFAGVVGGWAGEVPQEISDKVSKIDLMCDHIPVRIFKNKNLTWTENLPVVVYLHGGGFVVWSCTDAAYDGYLTRLAALGECVIVGVDYRLSQDAPYPAGLDDCYQATKWIVGGGAADAGKSMKRYSCFDVG